MSYAAGLTRIPARTFATATFAGMILPAAVIVGTGDAMGRLPLPLVAAGIAMLAMGVLGVPWAMARLACDTEAPRREI